MTITAFAGRPEHASGDKRKKVMKDPPMLTVDDSWTDRILRRRPNEYRGSQAVLSLTW